MRKFILILFSLVIMATPVFAKLQMPFIHTSIMLDAKFYSGDKGNLGGYDSDNRTQIRKAALEVTGTIDKYIDYGMEFGLSTCQGAGIEVKIMEASLLYNINDNIKFGLQQGHVLRGFSAKTECTERLTLEKPLFIKTFSNCHPTGVVLNANYDVTDDFGFEFEAALMNGENSTYRKEHDYNFGAIISTPLRGLSLSGYYNHTRKTYSTVELVDSINVLVKRVRAGYRYSAGLEYINNNIFLTGEYFQAKGFQRRDQEMKAYYVQGGYTFPIEHERLKFIRPYVKYELWDKDSKADGDHEFTYLDAGVAIGVTDHAVVKINYREQLDKPNNIDEEPKELVARLQLSF